MRELSHQEKERQNAAAVIDWLERVIYAVEKADYGAANYAMEVARTHLDMLQEMSEKKS